MQTNEQLLTAATLSEERASITVLDKDGLQEITFPRARYPQSTTILGMTDCRFLERVGHLVVVVFRSSPDAVTVWKMENGKLVSEAPETRYFEPILAVMGWKNLDVVRLVLCFDDSIVITDKTLRTVKRIRKKVAKSPVIAINRVTGCLGYPIHSDAGIIGLMCTHTEKETVEFQAHDSTVAAMQFSHSGEQIATASVRGTIIRVFTVATRGMLYEFRRGLKRTVGVTCLSFSKDDAYLTLASNTETVHVFDMKPQGEGWVSYFGSMAKSLTLVGKAVECAIQERAFATAALPSLGTGSTCAIMTIEERVHLVVVNLEGDLFIYDFPSKDAATTTRECHLLERHRIREVMCKDNDDGSTQAESKVTVTMTSRGSVAANMTSHGSVSLTVASSASKDSGNSEGKIADCGECYPVSATPP